MLSHRQIFLRHIGQTSDAPIMLEIHSAKGSVLTDVQDNKYLDLIGGISVANTGHGNPDVLKAIKAQARQYLHVMVNGELVLSPQTSYAQLLTVHLPPTLNSVFFTASGSEAAEGAMKLAKRYTGRTNMVAFNKSYHGSTQGALSIMGDEYWRNAFRPLLPGIRHAAYNSSEALAQITEKTACVLAESVQAEAGVIAPDVAWMQALRKRCTDVGALLVLDEIQCGFGRNGTLWAFEQYGIVPDILLLGKALGGGMPLGAFIADKNIMDAFTHHPVLGHMNTFGGHPVCCSAGKASMEYLLRKKLIETVAAKEKLFLKNIRQSEDIIAIRSKGLMIAIEFESFDINKKILNHLLKAGIFSDWFLFAPQCLRIAPPLTINRKQILQACNAINGAVEAVRSAL